MFILMLTKKQRFQHPNINNDADILCLNASLDSVVINIPKIIWIYWEGDSHCLVNRCIERVKYLHPDYQVNVLNPSNVIEFITFSLEDEIVKNATPQQRADLIRFDLIYRYGGIWLDASVILYERLDWINQKIQNSNVECFSYYRAKNTTKLEFPVIENWLLASVNNNIFFKLWFEELYSALKVGPKNYINNLKKYNQNFSEYFQNIGRLEYLIAYVACQKVMREHTVSIVLLNCDKNAFYYQVKNKWLKESFLIDMAIHVSPKIRPRLIKLVGKEREILNVHFINGQYLPDSLLDI